MILTSILHRLPSTHFTFVALNPGAAHDSQTQRKSPPPPFGVKLRFEQMEDRTVPAAIGGSVFYDVNNNGSWNAPEAGAAGVSVSLSQASGSPLSATTDAYGAFAFPGLNSGSYMATFSAPSGYTVGTPVGGSMSIALGTDDVSVVAGLVSGGSGGGGTGNGSAPVAVNDTAETIESTPVRIGVLGNDYDPAGGSVYLFNFGDASHGTVGFDFNNDLASVLYTPDAGYVGTDTFSYTIFATNGQQASAQVTVTVIPRLLHPMGDQASAEGGLVSVAVALGGGAAGQTLQFSASGLPAGLEINQSTGLISGRPQYSDAQTNMGDYAVTIAASTSTQSDSINLHWFISDTNRLSMIDDFLSKTNGKGDYKLLHSSQITAVDELHNALTFSLAGNSATITGTEDPAALGHWSTVLGGTLPDMTIDNTVTVSVEGGGATDTRSFKWHNDMSAMNIVAPLVDDTLTKVDDYQVVGKSIHVGYIISGDAALTGGSVTFSVFSGPAQISGSSTVAFAANPSGTVYVYTSATPTGTTLTSDEIKISGSLSDGVNLPVQLANIDLAAIEITIATGKAPTPFINRIRAATTPTGMGKDADRIPPRVNTSVGVFLKGALPDGAILKAIVSDESENNGTVWVVNRRVMGASLQPELIPGATGRELSVSDGYASFNLRGATQTMPGSARQLKVKVVDKNNAAKEIQSTAGFSVAAVPTDITMRFVIATPGAAAETKVGTGVYSAFIGNQYSFSAGSDSGDPTDLDKVKVREVVDGFQKEGIFSNANFTQNFGFVELAGIPQGKYLYDSLPFVGGLAATSEQDAIEKFQLQVFNNTLNFGTPAVGATGTVTSVQRFEFADTRTGVTEAAPVLIQNSGFKHKVSVKKLSDTKFEIKTQKTGVADVTNKVDSGTISATSEKETTVNLSKPQ